MNKVSMVELEQIGLGQSLRSVGSSKVASIDKCSPRKFVDNADSKLPSISHNCCTRSWMCDMWLLSVSVSASTLSVRKCTTGRTT
ncbi:hypothetical protein AALO_G00057870 [Alosa alosa]|uniref:Uncharacterized protein n=1 Tax=Alosa alosa TaxID=278164 RepID=A0AAV6H5L3_9TELE|nr:hypothetical protein AALO_G00057870 [Alosa alosa]